MTTRHGPMIAMPSSLEIDDSAVHAVQHCPSDEMLRRLEATLQALEPELPHNPRIVTLDLQPHPIADWFEVVSRT